MLKSVEDSGSDFFSILVLDKFFLIPTVPTLTKNSYILPIMNKIYLILNFKKNSNWLINGIYLFIIYKLNL
jgi:hypothetical protein